MCGRVREGLCAWSLVSSVCVRACFGHACGSCGWLCNECMHSCLASLRCCPAVGSRRSASPAAFTLAAPAAALREGADGVAAVVPCQLLPCAHVLAGEHGQARHAAVVVVHQHLRKHSSSHATAAATQQQQQSISGRNSAPPAWGVRTSRTAMLGTQQWLKKRPRLPNTVASSANLAAELPKEIVYSCLPVRAYMASSCFRSWSVCSSPARGQPVGSVRQRRAESEAQARRGARTNHLAHKGAAGQRRERAHAQPLVARVEHLQDHAAGRPALHHAAHVQARVGRAASARR